MDSQTGRQSVWLPIWRKLPGSALTTINCVVSSIKRAIRFIVPKHTMKGKRNEDAYEKAKVQLRRLKKKR